jgi:uncharacterized paraquat-inducible protein A
MREIYSKQLAIASGILTFLIVIIFSLLQSPEVISSDYKLSSKIPHPVEGYENCGSCHGINADWPYPIRHLGWSNNSCLKCHIPSFIKDEYSMVKEKGQMDNRITPNPHPQEGWDNCLDCHSLEEGILPVPANHKEWKNEVCGDCHLRLAQ